MEQRYPIDPEQVKTLTTTQLRKHFLMDDLFTDDAINMVAHG